MAFGRRPSRLRRAHRHPRLWITLGAALTMPLALATPAAVAGETLDDAAQLITLPRPIMAVYSHSTAVVPAERAQGGAAGGPGSAAANAAAEAGCNGGADLQDPQW